MVVFYCRLECLCVGGVNVLLLVTIVVFTVVY